MKRLVIIVLIFIFIPLIIIAQTITFDKMGLRGQGGSSDDEGSPGETISVSFEYSYTVIENPNNIYNNTGSGNNTGEIVVLWYSSSTWSTAPYEGYTDGITVSNLSMNNISGSGTGTFTFTLPTAPTGGNTITFFQIFFGCQAPNGFQTYYGEQRTSGKDFASFTAVNNAPTNYFTYMDYVDDTSTQAPTLDLPAASSTIGQSFWFQYDQPETAYDHTVKITFTVSAGTDPSSPHVLEVLSETSGTDISFELRGDILDDATEVIWNSGGNSLVDGCEYTVKIEYQDLAQNTAAFDQNGGVQYESDEAIVATGGDFNPGVSFAPGSTNNAYFWLRLVKNTSGTAIAVDDIEFNTTGSMTASDIDNLKIWRSTDNSFNSSVDTWLVTVTSPASYDPVTFDFSPDEDIDQTGCYYFITIDVSSSAEGSDAIGAEVESASKIDAGTAPVLGTFPITGGEHPLPVTMSSFTAQFTNGNPTLYWTTQSETNNEGWNIYRGNSQNMGQTILVNASGLILGQGTTSEPTDYIYTDQNGVVENTTYYYWLESVDNGGETEMFGPISLTIPLGGGNSGTPAAPDDYGLQQNYPNPFNPFTKIKFALEESSNVILTIYNTKGQKIQTLFKGNVPADIVKSVLWNGRDDSGKQVASGIYLYELQTNKETYTRKMILTK